MTFEIGLMYVLGGEQAGRLQHATNGKNENCVHCLTENNTTQCQPENGTLINAMYTTQRNVGEEHTTSLEHGFRRNVVVLEI